MSLADKKRDVFTKIGSYTSLMKQGKKPLQSDLFTSINNKNDTISFLLDVVKTVAGTEVLKKIIGGMFGKLIDESEPKLKNMLSKQFTQSNANEPMPASMTNNGINVPVKTIDVTGKLKTNPSSDVGNLIYGSTTNFDSSAFNAISNAGTPNNVNNVSIQYNSITDKMQIKPIGSSSVGDFFTSYIDNTELLNKKELMSSVMDSFYGTLSSKQNKTVEEIYNELMLEALLEQMLNGDDSFILSPEKSDELQTKANEMSEGIVNYDLGCGMMPAKLEFDDFNNLISSILNSTDPFFIGDQIGNTINQSTDDKDTSNENKETITDGFFQKIINIFTVKMLGAVTTAPQVRMLFGVMSSLDNGGNVSLGKPTNDIKEFKICIKCMANEIMKIVAEFIFLIAITYLIKLLKPVIQKVVKEKINQYAGILKSLTGKLGNVADKVT